MGIRGYYRSNIKKLENSYFGRSEEFFDKLRNLLELFSVGKTKLETQIFILYKFCRFRVIRKTALTETNFLLIGFSPIALLIGERS